MDRAFSVHSFSLACSTAALFHEPPPRIDTAHYRHNSAASSEKLVLLRSPDSARAPFIAMVLIPLKSQYVSLIITLVSGAAELTFLSALLHCNSFFECMALRRRSPLGIKSHRRRVTALASLALLLFVSLEIIVSYFSDPTFRILPQRRPCLAMRPIVPQDNTTKKLKMSRIISLGCVKTNGRFESQHVGNLSSSNSEVECAKQAAYRFVIGEKYLHTLSLPPDAEFRCSNEQDRLFCVFVFEQENQVFFSQSVNGLDAPLVTSGQFQLNYSATELFFDTSGLLGTIATRAAAAYSRAITDPADLRLEIFTATEQTSCSFGVKSDATEIALGALLAITTVWLISFCSFLGSVPLRRLVFYDMRNPIHWARQTIREVELPLARDPLVISEHEQGGLFLYLQKSPAGDKENTIQRERFVSQTGLW